MTVFRVLADDLTGALDSAAAFAGELTVCLDHWREEAPVTAVQVVATATRDILPRHLPDALHGLENWLAVADVAFKKVDSLLRGNTFAELEWLARTGRFDRLVLAPAFPAQGRHTLDGRLWLHGERQAGPTMGDRLAALPITVDIPDIHNDQDLDRCLDTLVDRPQTGPHAQGYRRRRTLWCGSAGLAHAWARRLNRVPSVPERPTAAQGPLVLIGASHHPVSRAQWRALESHLASTAGGVRLHRFSELAALQDVVTGMGSVPALFDLAPERNLTADQAAELLFAQVELLAAHLPRPGRLMVVGGDTLRALLDRCGAPILKAQASPWSGWGLFRCVSGPWAGVPVHSRSGAFGDERDLVTRWREASQA